MTQPVNQPSLRYDLHPRADARGTSPDPHQPEITIVKCFEDSAQRRSFHRSEGSSGVSSLSSHEDRIPPRKPVAEPDTSVRESLRLRITMASTSSTE